jgi:hypothetical protein
MVQRLPDPDLGPSSQQAGGQMPGNAFMATMTAPGSQPVSPDPAPGLAQHLPLPQPSGDVPAGDKNPQLLARPRGADGRWRPTPSAA